MRRLEKAMLEEWTRADEAGEQLFPARVHVPDAAQRARWSSTTRSTRRIRGCTPRWRRTCRWSCRAGRIRRSATCTPSHCITGEIEERHTVRTGIEYMMRLAEWYTETATAIVDRLLPDRRRHRRRFSDLRRADAAPGSAAHRCCRCGATSARSAIRPPATARTRAPCRTRRSPGASSAVDTPKYMIESDASIVAPLIFAFLLGD